MPPRVLAVWAKTLRGQLVKDLMHGSDVRWKAVPQMWPTVAETTD